MASLFVRLDGRPLRDAQVTLVPESFLGDAVKSAHGISDENGMVRPRISDKPDEAGLHPGFYRVEVSKKVGAKETIPPRYNEHTVLGLEASSDATELLGLVLDLGSQ